MKSHIYISLFLLICLTLFGGQANILQASLNLNQVHGISQEEFQELEDSSIHIYIDNEYKQTRLKNLRLDYKAGLIKVSDTTDEAFESLFTTVRKPSSAELLNKSQSLYLKPSKHGNKINLNLLEKELNSHDFHVNRTIRLKTYQLAPSYTTQQARVDLNLIKANEEQKITFKVRSELGNYSSQVFSIYEFATYYKTDLKIDKTALLETLDTFREQVESPSSNIKIVPSQTDLKIHSIGNLGQKVLIEDSLELIQNAIEDKRSTINLKYKVLLPSVYTDQGQPSSWKAISFGASDYTGSIENRVTNIKLAANHVYNNTLIMPNKNFSYNELLMSRGRWIDWKTAFIIVNGGDLKEAPGGGLCQVSTTIYRAAINAGLPIANLKNHSLYIKYYKKHGDGLDATIFPGYQDLSFENNLSSPILMQVYTNQNNKLITVLYSQSEAKQVNLFGPIYSTNQHEFPNITVEDNQIKWIREFSDGSESEIFTSTYNEKVG